jgi:hypothetical protein
VPNTWTLFISTNRWRDFRKPVGHVQSASAYRNLMLMQRLADFRNQVAS